MKKQYIMPQIDVLLFAPSALICQSLDSTEDASSNEGDEAPKVAESKSDFLWFDNDFDNE